MDRWIDGLIDGWINQQKDGWIEDGSIGINELYINC